MDNLILCILNNSLEVLIPNISTKGNLFQLQHDFNIGCKLINKNKILDNIDHC